MSIDDLWYKNAIIYCLDVEKYMDANGDGVGDFEGLGRRLPYLAGIGVNCVWLLPFYPSPNRDNGYDVTDYYGVHEKHGSLGDFVEFMHVAKAHGIRVIVDLVVNHTSIDHPWFQHARSHQDSPFRDWYVWSKQRPEDHDQGMVFPGVQETTWTWDEEAKQYYFHRFYDHQADLDAHHKAVRDEIFKIMGFWLELGVTGFRMDAVPFLVEYKGADVEHRQDFELLHEMRDFLQWRSGDAILLAEANVTPDKNIEYFGDEGDRLQLMLNFPVNQRLWYALATGDIEPLKWALEATRERPRAAQWVQFLRSHDEQDLGRLTDEQRRKVFEACAPDEDMQLYDRGIRRRLAPMLHNDRRRMELAFSLLFSLPGTPMMQYGDEIGMGDDLSLPERECARTAMQWTNDPYGGFSTAETPGVPIITDETYGYETLNAANQRRDPNSILNWSERRIRMRKECPEISWGHYVLPDPHARGVLAILYTWRSTSLLTVHNFTGEPQTVRLDLEVEGRELLADVFENDERHAGAAGVHEFTIQPYGHHWYRIGTHDNALHRADRDQQAPEAPQA
jgi:maltose alpha-D-glucosyltransferase / alpha-amylase